MNKNLLTAVAGIALFSTLPSQAQEFKGAGYLVEQIEQRHQESRDGLDQLSLWKRDMLEFEKGKTQLTLEKQAQEWLGLYDRMWTAVPSGAPSDSYGDQNQYFLQQWLRAVPDPETWEFIYQSTSGRSKSRKPADVMLRYIACFLVQDAQGMKTALKDMDLFADKFSDDWRSAIQSSVDEIARTLINTIGTPEEKAEFWVSHLKKSEYSSVQPSSVPDLVAMVGPDKAKEYLTRAMIIPGIMLQITEGKETRELAQATALELVEKMATPQWGLADSVNADDLFEALTKKFPAPVSSAVPSYGDEGYFRAGAAASYLMSLIIQGRDDEAKKAALEVGAVDQQNFYYKVIGELEGNDTHKQSVEKFLRELLKENPQLKLWPYYLYVAGSLGDKAAEMTGLLTEALAKPDLPNAMELRGYLFTAYVSQGLWDEARQVIKETGSMAVPVNIIGMQRQLLEAFLARDLFEQAGPVLEAIDAELKKDLSGEERKKQAGELAGTAVTLVSAGRLLDNTQWVQKGLDYFELAAGMISEIDLFSGSFVSNYMKALIDLGKYTQAEERLIKEILRKIPAGNDQYASSAIARDMAALVHVYFKAGRYGDIIVLLDSFPYWMQPDLANMGPMYDDDEVFEYMTAKAFAEGGNVELGLRLAKQVILKRGGYDPSYELLMQHEPRYDLVTWFDRLYERDPFEERPLIWKANLLLKFQKYDEAEEAAKKAIAVDPSDGEQGAGNRMRVYAVMAEIKRAQGKPEEAEHLEKIVEAIRLSEQADKFYDAHLTGRALTMYAQALDIFDGAYCIQSRLALRLAKEGRHVEADKHFIKAFKLMPDSFGRMESHCFGCERIFSGERQQVTAEKVFTSMIAENPKKPQLYYLMGYLRSEQGRPKEAFDYFQKAVEFDPQYINAWVKLENIAGRLNLPLDEREKISVNLFKIDPYFRHSVVDPKRMWGIKTVWNLLKNRKDPLVVEPPVSYPLKAAQEKAAKPADVDPSEAVMIPEGAFAPNDVLAGHELLQGLYVLSYYFLSANTLNAAGDSVEAVADPAKVADPADIDEAAELKAEEQDAGEAAEAAGDLDVAEKKTVDSAEAVAPEPALKEAIGTAETGGADVADGTKKDVGEK